MEQLARQYIRWTNIDDGISKIAFDFEIYKSHNHLLAKDYESWSKSTRPWERLHMDFAGRIFTTM